MYIPKFSGLTPYLPVLTKQILKYVIKEFLWSISLPVKLSSNTYHNSDWYVKLNILGI